MSEELPRGGRFRKAWERMARLGYCDGWGGAECRRVYRAWVRAGRPWPIASWIAVAANVVPSAPSRLPRYEPGKN